jgi:glycosyltransferase involved in cell wall biosynthesis
MYITTFLLIGSMSPRILVIIPCYNEAASLPAVIKDLNEIRNRYECSVLVVNDCSKDSTADIARKLPVILLDLPVNLGIGGAMQSGYLYAQRHGFDMAIQLDGDGQHLPSEIPKLVDQQLSTGANLVIGSRFLGLRSFRSSFLRRTGIYYFHLLNKLLIGKSVYDCTSGFRLMDKEAIALAAALYPDEYPEPESLILFSRYGMKIEEIPVIMRERQGGQSSIGSFSSFYYMVKVSIAMIFSYIRYSKKRI